MADADQTSEQIAGVTGDEFRRRILEVLTRRLSLREGLAPLGVLGANEGPESVGRGRAHLRALGSWAIATWPAEFGGLDLTPAQAAILTDELKKFDVPDMYAFRVSLGMVAPILFGHGTQEQKLRWLPPIGTGTEIWCQLFSEPGAGSDLAALATRATQVEGGWLVSGQKVWTSRAHYSQRGLLLARSDSSAPKHAGITAFGMDMTSPGITLRPIRQMNGDEHFSEVFLDDVFVPDSDRIGAPGEGWRVAITTLAHERGAFGDAEGIEREHVIDLLWAHGLQRDPVLRQWAARLIIDIEIARLNAMRAQAEIQRGITPGPAAAGGKIRLAALMRELGDLAMAVHGPRGMLEGGEWQSIFQTAPSISIRGGTDDIQRNIIGERVLGLPPEPRTDRDRPFASS